MSRRMESTLAAVIGMTLAGLAGCQQQPQSIPQPPIAAPRTPVSETPGTASTRPAAGLNDPAALEAKIKQLVGELETAKRAGGEIPRISDPLPKEGSGDVVVGSSTPAPGATVTTPPPVESSANAAPEAIPASFRDAPPTPPPEPVRSQATGTSVDAPLGANQPVAITPLPAIPMTSTATLSDLDATVAQRVARDPRDVSAQIDSAILAYLREEPSPDPSKVAALPQEDREVVAAVIDSLVNFRAVTRANPNAMYASRVRPFAELSDRLKMRSDLSVPTVIMASKVDSFGVYEPMPQVLSSRGETVTIIYTEVANFSSRLTEKRLWETRLAGEMMLYDSNGKLVWQFRPPNTLDLCRNRRNDFCVSYVVRIPPQPAGRYVLKVSVTDLNVQRVAEGVMPLESK